MSEDIWFMPTACKHCPFRNDVKPFLTPERGEELAMSASNPYNTFYCHKTTVSDEEYGGEGDECVANEDSLLCAGFLMLQINEGMDCPENFNPDWTVAYQDSYEMMDAYYNQ